MMRKESEHSHRAERSLVMTSVAYLSEQLDSLFEARADELARETGCVQRQRQFSGASLLQTWVFGWQQHPDASLEQLASVAELHDVEVRDTAVQKRFTPQAAAFLQRVLEEACSLVVQAAQDVPVALLRRFSAVILEDSSSIALPDELAEVWRGCGGNQEHTAAAVKVHVRWELKRGRLWGPALTDGRTSDRRSPFTQEEIVRGSLEIKDLGYFQLDHLEARRQAGAYSLTRWQAGTALFTNDGKPLALADVLPPRVGQLKELPVRVGARHWLPMRLLMLRVPKAVGDQRRCDRARGTRNGADRQCRRRPCDWQIGPSCSPMFLPSGCALRKLWCCCGNGGRWSCSTNCGSLTDASMSGAPATRGASCVRCMPS
jgi:hypothetical protein